MNNSVKDILEKDILTKQDIVTLLMCEGEDKEALFAKSASIKEKYIGKKIWVRGLVEFSNICGKDCLYCGIRKGNRNIARYNLADEEIIGAAMFEIGRAHV